MKNKNNRTKALKKIQRENWELCKEIVDLRDGHVCQIPNCDAPQGLQLDHVISRMCKTTFFETDILGWLCGSHHTHKSFRKGQWVDLTTRDICVKKIGSERWHHLVIQSCRNCYDFNKIWYQEKENIRLKEQRAMLLENS